MLWNTAQSLIGFVPTSCFYSTEVNINLLCVKCFQTTLSWRLINAEVKAKVIKIYLISIQKLVIVFFNTFLIVIGGDAV